MSGYFDSDGKYQSVHYHEWACYLSGMAPDGKPFPYDLEEFVKRHRDPTYAKKMALHEREENHD